MKRLWWLTLAVVLTPGLTAQQRDSVRQRPDSARGGPGANAEQLRMMIEQRFNQRVQENLKLTPDQATKLRASQEKFGAQRRSLMEQQQDRRRALEDQMEPGVAANADSVRKLLDGIQAGRSQMLKIEQDQDREMAGYLTPVQRARYQQMRERLFQRVGEMRREGRGRGMGRGEGRGGYRPRRRPI